jgi:hypothetical protein
LEEDWSDTILFRHGVLSTARTQSLERQDSLSSWSLFHRKNTETGTTRFSFVMESCPQKEHRHWRDKILFRRGVLSTARTEKIERQNSLSSWSLVHSTNRETRTTKFSFVVESCPQNEHSHWRDNIPFRYGVLSTERTEKQLQMCSQDLTGRYVLLQSPLQLTICSINTLHPSLHYSTGKCTALQPSSWFCFATAYLCLGVPAK